MRSAGTKARRRVYSELHVGWLQLMERLRRTGMSIAEMRDYTALVEQGKASLKQREQMLRAHRERVQRTIEEWNEALALLDGKIDFYGQWQASGKRPPLDVLTSPAPAPAPVRKARR
jgi:DNA-binding transcriptional MerR regulator